MKSVAVIGESDDRKRMGKKKKLSKIIVEATLDHRIEVFADRVLAAGVDRF